MGANHCGERPRYRSLEDLYAFMSLQVGEEPKRISRSFWKLLLIAWIWSSRATISKSSCDELPRLRVGSMPDWEHGELDFPKAPPPLTDRPVSFFFIFTSRRDICKLFSWIDGNRRRTFARWVSEPFVIIESRPFFDESKSEFCIESR